MNVMWKQVSKESRPRRQQKHLSTSCQLELKSSVNISTFTQCVEELILNAIDAKSNCVSVRVDIPKYFIQVVDNGRGIAQKEMLKLGQRHSTNKPLPHSVTGKAALTNSLTYGHRGEALASAIQLSDSVEIVSRSGKSSTADTYSKTFKEGLGSVVKLSDSRPCCGTTVTVQDLFKKCPVRRKQASETQTLKEVVHLVRCFGVSLAGRISFSLRDEQRGKVLMNTARSKNTKEALLEVFGIEYCSSLSSLRGSHDRLAICGVLSTIAYTSRKLKLVTLNGRIIDSSRVQQTIDSLLKNSLINVPNARMKNKDSDKVVAKPKNYLYVVDLKCSHKMYCFNIHSDKTSVQFDDWKSILDSIHKIVKKFLITHNLHKGIDFAKNCSAATSEHDKSKDVSSSLVQNESKQQSPSGNKSNSQLIPSPCASPRENDVEQPQAPQSKTHPQKKVVPTKPAATKHQPPTKPISHVVYWLTHHVPSEVPQLEEEEFNTNPTQSSLAVNLPGSTGHLSTTKSTKSDASLLSSQPLRLHNLSSSFNDGKELPSIFGSCLKVVKNANTKAYDSADPSDASGWNRSLDHDCPGLPVFHINRQLVNKYKHHRGHYSDSRLETMRFSTRQVKTPEIDQSLLKRCLSASKTGKSEPIPDRSLQKELIFNPKSSAPKPNQRLTLSVPKAHRSNAWKTSFHHKTEKAAKVQRQSPLNRNNSNELVMENQGFLYKPSHYKRKASPVLVKTNSRGAGLFHEAHQLKAASAERLFGRQEVTFDPIPDTRVALNESPADEAVFASPDCRKRPCGLFHPDLLESPERERIPQRRPSSFKRRKMTGLPFGLDNLPSKELNPSFTSAEDLNLKQDRVEQHGLFGKSTERRTTIEQISADRPRPELVVGHPINNPAETHTTDPNYFNLSHSDSPQISMTCSSAVLLSSLDRLSDKSNSSTSSQRRSGRSRIPTAPSHEGCGSHQTNRCSENTVSLREALSSTRDSPPPKTCATPDAIYHSKCTRQSSQLNCNQEPTEIIKRYSSLVSHNPNRAKESTDRENTWSDLSFEMFSKNNQQPSQLTKRIASENEELSALHGTSHTDLMVANSMNSVLPMTSCPTTANQAAPSLLPIDQPISDTLISSFTSQELLLLDSSKAAPVEQVHNCVKLYVDKRTGNTIPEHSMPQVRLDESPMIPGSPHRFVNMNYRTPNCLPKLQSITNLPQTQNFIAFQKELSTAVTSQTKIILEKDLLLKQQVIGQWSKQMILLVVDYDGGKGNLILAVDQHAAHERVRLEMLEDQHVDFAKDRIIPAALLKPLQLGIRSEEISSKELVAKAARFGIELSVKDSALHALSIPSLVLDNCSLQYAQDFAKSVLTEVKDYPSVQRPKAFTDCINSISCRGAIKFGDQLNADECQSLMKKLGKCRLPFQCAHGRPSCFPICNISQQFFNQQKHHGRVKETGLNFKRIKRFIPKQYDV